jgi:hypothetical protein
MENTQATPIEMILVYSDLREEYESAPKKDKGKIMQLAVKRFEAIDANDLDTCGAFKEDVNYNWDELGL